MKIIVVSGMDGAGKTSLCDSLATFFAPKKVARLHLPYSTFSMSALAISGDGSAFGDPWTDRLIFALDNRLVAYKIQQLRKEGYDYLIMQRGWMDSFVAGAVQGFSYEQIHELLHTYDLPRVDCTVHLNCTPDVAYGRIKDDRDGDKYETPEYLNDQYKETLRFYESTQQDSFIKELFPEEHLYIDTTDAMQAHVVDTVIDFICCNKLV
jgi:thymidylate kinase